MKRFFIFVIVAICLTVSCFAEEIDKQAIENSLSDSAEQIAGDINNASDFGAFSDRLVKAVKAKLHDSASAVIEKLVSVIIICVLCSVLELFGNDKAPDYIWLCGCAAISAICIGDVNSFIKMGSNTVSDIADFSKLMLPAMCTAAASCGEISSSAVRYAASALFMDIFISIAESIILPVIYAYLAVSIASSAFDNALLSSVSKLLKWAGTSLMVLLALSFTVYISVSNAIATTTDAVTAKLAKTAISSALPVVGGIISDAASTVVAGAQLIKNTLGAFALIAVISICIGPVVVIGLNYLALKAVGAFSGAICNSTVSKTIDSISTALGMVLGLVGCCTIIMFVSAISCMRTVTG